MSIHKILGANIKKHRLKKGLTQEALATKASFSSNYIACVERAEEKLTLDGLVRVAKALGVKPSVLLEPEAGRQVP